MGLLRRISAARRQLSDTGCIDAAIAVLAAGQDGYVGRWQIELVGIGDGAIARRVKSGVLVRVRWGVCSFGTPNTSPRGRCWAAVLAGGPGAVVAGTAAGYLWGLRNASLHVIEVIVPRRLKDQPGIHFRHEVLPADEISHELGVPATTAIRTAFDLAGTLQPWQTERVVNEIEAKQLWSAISYQELLRRHPHRKGNRVMRRIIAAGNLGMTQTHEGTEEEFVGFCDRHGLPRPVTTTMIDGLTATHEADCVWRSSRVNLEIDSGWHDTRAAGESDVARDLDLEAAGWTVVRIRLATLRDSADLVLARLRGLLG